MRFVYKDRLEFVLNHRCKKTSARAGVIKTDMGLIKTPIFMPVGTAATVKGIHQKDLDEDICPDIILANTYHLFLRPGTEIIKGEKEKLETLKKWCLKNNISPKIFLVEKPASYEYHNFKKFVDYCNTKKIRIVVNYQRSFSSSLSIMNTFLNKQKKIKIEVYYKKGFYIHYKFACFLIKRP